MPRRPCGSAQQGYHDRRPLHPPGDRYALRARPRHIASAEGAWVLWGRTQDPWGSLEAVRLGGGLSREACEQERSNLEKAPPALRMASYSCLPDTGDPPVPKSE